MHILIYIGIIFIIFGAIGSYLNSNSKYNKTEGFHKCLTFLKALNIYITLIGTITIIIGGQLDGANNKDEIKDNNNRNTEKVLSVLDLILIDDFAGALHIFHSGNVAVKKGVILELKNKAINKIEERQKIINFLASLNDWIDDHPVLKSEDIQWSEWIIKEKLLKVNDSIICKDKQQISLEVSKAINEIVYAHVQQLTSFKLDFYNKNILGLIPTDIDFSYGNVNFSGADLFGFYVIGCRSMDKTEFIYAKYYGSCVFRDCYLPTYLNISGEFGTEYNGNLTFIDVKFRQGLNLINTRIKGNVRFLNCEFFGNVNINLVKFDRELRFNRGIFHNKVNFNSSHFGAESSFFYSEFKSNFLFTSVKIDKNIDFKGVKFTQAPDFNEKDMRKILNLKI